MLLSALLVYTAVSICFWRNIIYFQKSGFSGRHYPTKALNERAWPGGRTRTCRDSCVLKNISQVLVDVSTQDWTILASWRACPDLLGYQARPHGLISEADAGSEGRSWLQTMIPTHWSRIQTTRRESIWTCYDYVMKNWKVWPFDPYAHGKISGTVWDLEPILYLYFQDFLWSLMAIAAILFGLWSRGWITKRCWGRAEVFKALWNVIMILKPGKPEGRERDEISTLGQNYNKMIEGR